jgi:hypothetical protein
MQLSLFLLSAAAMVSAATATDSVDLGTAADFVILAKSGISTEPSSDVTGNIGVSPIAATAITGFSMVEHSSGLYSTASQLTGKAYASTYDSPTPSELTTAVSNMETAYTDAASRPVSSGATVNVLGGKFNTATTLEPNVYSFDTDVAINAELTFDALGDSDAIFIVQMTGSLTQAANTDVVLAGGAQAKNIFWQVAGSVAVGVGSVLNGIVLVKTEAVFKTGASLHGRVLTQTACTLDQAVITQPSSA